MTIKELEKYFNEPTQDLTGWNWGQVKDYREWLEDAYQEDTRYISLEEAWDRA